MAISTSPMPTNRHLLHCQKASCCTSGSEWLVMDTQSASDTGWQPRTVDLGQFREQTVRLRFRLETSDEQDVTSVGVWLDGISLTSQR